MTTVGQMKANGLSIYAADQTSRLYEIGTGQEIKARSSEEFVFSVAVRHQADSQRRWGKVFTLEEEYRVFLLDFVEHIGGGYLRSYEAIESLSATVAVDLDAIVETIFSGMMKNRFFEVLEFLTTGVTTPDDGSGPHKDPYQRCVKRNTNILCGCHENDKVEIFPAAPASYNFYKDFFSDNSMWSQWVGTGSVINATIRKYLDEGSPAHNYINNIYPEQTSVLDYRSFSGGYSVSQYEMKKSKPYIFAKMKKWYSGRNIHGNLPGRVVPVSRYTADSKTIEYFTDIADVEIKEHFLTYEPTLVRLLGPYHCIKNVPGIGCVQYGYGTPALGEKERSVVGPSTFANQSFGVVTAPSYRDTVLEDGLLGEEAFYSIFVFGGIVGGQKVFNGGVGNEYRYVMSFGKFLSEQQWSIRDFLEIYSTEVEEFKRGLLSSLSTRVEEVHPRDFCEFYDRVHPCPFDGAEVYIPIIPVLDQGEVKVYKEKVTYEQDGTFTIEDRGNISLSSGQMTLSLDEGEYVSSIVTKKALRTILSDFVRIDIAMRLKTSFGSDFAVSPRVSTNDFTYLSIGDFYYG